MNVEIDIKRAQAIVLEEVDELGSDTPIGDKLILQLSTQTGHRMLGCVYKLCRGGNVALLGIGIKSCCDGDNGH